MSYFECAYFDQTYFATDCAPAGGRGSRGMARINPPPPLDEGDELFALF